MDFIDKLDRSWELVAASWKILMLDKEMLLFPILSTIALGAVSVLSLGPAWQSGELQAVFEAMRADPELLQSPQLYVALFLAYFCAFFIIVFFNSALLTCAMIRMAGGDPTVMDGLRAAMRNIMQIFLWALFASSIGFLLRMLEHRLDFVGKIVVGLIGTAWAIASYFAIPVLVVENCGPVTAVRQSVQVMRKTWGEAAITTVGLSVLHWGSALGMSVFFFLGMKYSGTDMALSIVFWSAGIAWLLGFSLVISVLSSILRAALYIYAREGVVPQHFNSALLRKAFIPEEK